MNKKIIYLIIGLIAASVLWYEKEYFTHSSLPQKETATVYDQSIRVAPGEPIQVAKVIDGDTIVLANGEHLRYIGVDTPEEVDPRKSEQCYAREAAQANRQLVERKTIIFQQDVSSHDKYGRWLGFVYLLDGPKATAGTFVNAALVRSGYAFAYPYKPDISRASKFRADESAARTEKLGLWSYCTVYRTSSGREQTNDLH